jgi:hypothetical protein
VDHNLVFRTQNGYVAQNVADCSKVFFIWIAQGEPSPIDFVEPEWARLYLLK